MRAKYFAGAKCEILAVAQAKWKSCGFQRNKTHPQGVGFAISLLGGVGFADGFGQLVGAGGGSSAAGVASELFIDFLGCPAVDELRDSLEVAVAAAGEADVGHNALIDVKVDFERANALGMISVVHKLTPF